MSGRDDAVFSMYKIYLKNSQNQPFLGLFSILIKAQCQFTRRIYMVSKYKFSSNISQLSFRNGHNKKPHNESLQGFFDF